MSSAAEPKANVGERPFASTLPAPAELLAGHGYSDVLPRLEWPIDFLFGDLLYEIPNASMRRLDSRDGRPLTGEAVAQRWRRTVEMTRGAFILRDSLFSQQDHPYALEPYAIMLPPGWIAAAVADVSAGVELLPMCTPPVDDDGAWQQVREASVMFGSFPPSPILFRFAHGLSARGRSPTPAQIRNARSALRALARESAALLDAAPHGAEAVARAGAIRVAASDVRYFGRDLRRSHVIPIVVENPTAHERREGKGLMPVSRPDVSEKAVRLVRNQLLGRRLREGDIAIERYDLSSLAEREQATGVLRDLIPRGAPPGGVVWLWMAGPRVSPDGGCDERVATQTRTFLSELERSGVDRSRLRLVRKPDLTMEEGPDARRSFDAAVARCAALDILLPVNKTASGLRAWIAADTAIPPNQPSEGARM